MATVDRMTLLSTNRQRLKRRKIRILTSYPAPALKTAPIRLTIVENLDQAVTGRVLSWRPILLDVSIRADQLDFLRRVMTCQSARGEESGVVWAAQQIVGISDELIAEIVSEISGDIEQQAARLDRVAMIVAVAGLGIMPIMPLLGMSVVLLSMLAGWSGWLLAMHRSRTLSRLLTYLEETREQRIAQICLHQIAKTVQGTASI